MDYLLIFASGVVFGSVVVLMINWLRSSQTQEIARHLVDVVETQRIDDMDKILGESQGIVSGIVP